MVYSPQGHRELDMTNNSNKSQISQVNEFSTFLVGKCRIFPLICSSALWDQHPVLSFPESPQGAPLGVAAAAEDLAAEASWPLS